MLPPPSTVLRLDSSLRRQAWAKIDVKKCRAHAHAAAAAAPSQLLHCSTNVCCTMLMKRRAYSLGSIADTPSASQRRMTTFHVRSDLLVKFHTCKKSIMPMYMVACMENCGRKEGSLLPSNDTASSYVPEPLTTSPSRDNSSSER